MNRRTTFAFAFLPALLSGTAVLSPAAVAQQSGTTMHKYIYRAVFTSEGLKDLQKRTASGLRVCPETSGRIGEFSEHEAN
jgi:hypothetical protein